MAFDNFNRVSIGTNWSQIGANPKIGIVSNQVGSSTDTFIQGAYTALGVLGDQFCQATLINIATGTTMITVRSTGTNLDAYQLYVDGNASLGGAGTYKVSVTSGGVRTILPALNSFLSAVIGDVMRLEIVGKNVKAYVNGVKIADTTDSRLASGYPAISLNNISLSTPYFDDWSGGALPAQAFDNFNRAAIGTDWDTVGVGGFPTLAIISNQAGGTDTAFQSAYKTLGAMTDQFVQVTLVRIATGGTGMLARASLTAATWYVFGVESGGNYAMSKLLANSLSALPRLRLQAAVVGDVMRLEIVGTSIKAYVNGVKIVDTTDSDIASGFPGLIMNNGPASVAYFDNWSGGQMPQTKQIGPLPAYRPDML